MTHHPKIRHKQTPRARAVLITAVITAAAVVAGCSSSGSSAGPASSGAAQGSIPAGPITLGETLPLSGPLAQVGGFEKLEVTDAVAVMNANGGIAGHQINLVTLDDKGDPATALANSRQLISMKVAGIVNESLGSASQLTEPFFMKAGIPTVLAESNMSFLNASQYPTYFTPYASAEQYGAAYVAYLKAHGLNNLGVIDDGTPVSDEYSQETVQLAKQAGLHVSASITYSPTAVDLTPQMTQLKDSGAQVVIDNGFSSPNNVFDAINQIGWKPLTLGVGVSVASTASTSFLGGNAYFPCNYYYTSAAGQPSAVAGQLLAKVAKLLPPIEVSGVLGWYDILQTLKYGIQKAGTTDYKSVSAALESGVAVPSIWTGITYRYSATNHEGFANGAMKVCAATPLGADGVGIAAS
jgi:ABC-type branched-subunit amino acid transport system substrate-binding protein